MSAKTTPIFLIILAAVVGYIAYEGLEIAGVPGLSMQKAHVVAIRDTIAKLEAETDKAKKELAKGTVDDLRKKLETYRSSLALLRRHFPPVPVVVFHEDYTEGDLRRLAELEEHVRP